MTDYTPTTESLSRLWLMHHLANSPDMKHDPDGSEADDGFREWMQAHNRKIAAEAAERGWDEALEHVWALNDPASTVRMARYPGEEGIGRGVLVDTDIDQARDENPYRADRIEQGDES